MKKLSLVRQDLRDLLLMLWFEIPYDGDDTDFTYERVVRPTRHNYERDKEMYRGAFKISYKGRKIGQIETKPHRKLVLARQYDRYQFYEKMLDAVARDVAPGLRVEYS